MKIASKFTIFALAFNNMDIIKKILPVLIGMLSGILLVIFADNLVELIYPIPENIDPNNELQLAEYIKDMPASAYLVLIINYALAALAAGLIATAISKKNNKGLRTTSPVPAIICGGILTVAGFVNALNLSHPTWFVALCLVTSLPFAYTGYWVLRRRRKTDPLSL